MWFAHFIIPMIAYYLLFPHINAYSLLIGAFFANIDAIVVKMNLKDSEFHLNSFFHSIPFGLLCSLVFIPFGIKDVISFNIGHIIHLLLDSGSDSGIRPLYPLKFSMSLKLWKNSFSLGFKDDYLTYFSKNYLFEVSSFIILVLLIPKEILRLFGDHLAILYATSLCSFGLFIVISQIQPKVVGLILSISTLAFAHINSTVSGFFFLAQLFNLFMVMILVSVKQERKVLATLFFVLLCANYPFFLIQLLIDELVPPVATILAFCGMMSSLAFIWVGGLLNKFARKNAPIGI